MSVHAALGYDTGRMVVIPNGYDLLRFAPDPSLLAEDRLRREEFVDPKPIREQWAERL